MLTALGLLHPLGPFAILAAMSMATIKGHWGSPSGRPRVARSFR
jgi:hypothetical protein